MERAELTIEIDAQLLQDARDAGLDLEGIVEAALKRALLRTPQGEALAEARARHWALENAEAIKAHRERIEKYGVWSDDLRTW